MHEYLTSKEVAELLRIKERKLYELCAEGALPVTRVTGKLLFPRQALMRWLHTHTQRHANTAAPRHNNLIAGSHDPLLDWALRHSQCGYNTYFDGSFSGIEKLQSGDAALAGMHFYGERGNAQAIEDALPGAELALLHFARRQQGLLLRQEDQNLVHGLTTLGSRRFIIRQNGAGSRALLSQLLCAEGLSEAHLTLCPLIARSEQEVGAAIVSAKADVGLGIAATAKLYQLHFIPLAWEHYDLAIWHSAYFEPSWQTLLATISQPSFREQALALGGYDIEKTGQLRYNNLHT